MMRFSEHGNMVQSVQNPKRCSQLAASGHGGVTDTG